MGEQDDVDSDDLNQAGLQAPFTREQLQKDLGTVMLTMVRQLSFVFDRNEIDWREVQLRLLGVPEHFERFNLDNPDLNWENCGFNYDMIRSTRLAEGVENLYDLAYLGEIDSLVFDLNSESTPSWFSRILYDLNRSTFVLEWSEYSKCSESISRCLLICETAEAKLILERQDEDDTFMNWHSPLSDGLSIRQMALLSGMTEPSLRTMANPKRKNPLKTQSDGKNTFVAVDDAKEWLILKGRYIPMKRTSRGGRVDITTRRFSSTDELLSLLNMRLNYLLGEPAGEETRRQVFDISTSLICKTLYDTSFLDLSEVMLADPALMARVGDALKLPGELLALRTQELLAVQKLREVELQIQQFTAL